MSDQAPRSYLRNSSGPHAVDAGSGREKGSGGSRRHRDGDERGHHRSKRDSSHRSPKKDSSHRRKHSTQVSDTYAERPYFELDVIGQPPRGVALGMVVDVSVMVSLRLPSPDRNITADSIDTSRLLAVASLVAENRSGERVPLEAGLLTGQKMFDTVHEVPDEWAQRMAGSNPCRVVLGYFTFPSMLVRQSGTFRIRTTLIKMSTSGAAGGSSILAVDSEPVKIERRSIATPRRHQRVHAAAL